MRRMYQLQVHYTIPSVLCSQKCLEGSYRIGFILFIANFFRLLKSDDTIRESDSLGRVALFNLHQISCNTSYGSICVIGMFLLNATKSFIHQLNTSYAYTIVLAFSWKFCSFPSATSHVFIQILKSPTREMPALLPLVSVGFPLLAYLKNSCTVTPSYP